MNDMKLFKTLNAGVINSEKRKETSNSNSTAMKLLSTHTSTTISWVLHAQIIQSFRLVWLDRSIDEISNDDSINTIINYDK